MAENLGLDNKQEAPTIILDSREYPDEVQVASSGILGNTVEVVLMPKEER